MLHSRSESQESCAQHFGRISRACPARDACPSSEAEWTLTRSTAPDWPPPLRSYSSAPSSCGRAAVGRPPPPVPPKALGASGASGGEGAPWCRPLARRRACGWPHSQWRRAPAAAHEVRRSAGGRRVAGSRSDRSRWSRPTADGVQWRGRTARASREVGTHTARRVNSLVNSSTNPATCEYWQLCQQRRLVA